MKQGKAWGQVEQVETDGLSKSVDVLRIKPGGYSSEHWHEHKSNLFHVLSGQLEIRQWLPRLADGGEIMDVTILGPGEATTIPCGVWHQFKALEETVVIEICEGRLIGADIQRRTQGGA